MCGIAGIFDLRAERDINRDALTRMTRALAHRGPDGEGFHIEPGLGLGHRRLSIIDLHGGAQPFVSNSGDTILTFNGEIYNYRDLQQRLSEARIALRTASDTETLAEGLEAHGRSWIDSLEGMFAFAAWSRRDGSLLIARDRVGEKPLYYGETADGFLVFASEAGALEESGLFDLEFDAEALADYFLYGYVPDPKSIYRNIRKLPPGHLLHVTRGQPLTLERYWRPDFSRSSALSEAEAAEALLEALDRAVGKQLVADVPLGAFLSGGVDSSAIISSMRQHTDRITAATIGFEDDAFDERPYARRVAEQYGVAQHEEIMRLEASALIDRIAATFSEPFADASALPTFLVCEAARRHVTVALSGDGGDELFGGYRRYPFFAAEERVRNRIPASLRRALISPLGEAYPKLDWAPRPLRFKTTLQSIGDDRQSAYARAAGISLPDRARSILSQELRAQLGGYNPVSVVERAAKEADTDDPLAFAQQIDFATWLPGRMLVKVDRASMAHGLEVRPPLLDAAFVRLANDLPSSFKLSGFSGKRILKKALEARLPEDILYRRKQGFSLPLASWLREKNGPLQRLNVSSAWRQSGLIDERFVERMTRDHQRGAADFSQELWSVIMFDAFLQQHEVRRQSF